MFVYLIVRFPFFVEQFEALNEVNKERVRRIVIQLEANGPLVGKPLGYLFLREKKFNGNRLYFLFYKEWSTVLLVAIGDKKDQTETIQNIKLELAHYRGFVEQQLKELGVI